MTSQPTGYPSTVPNRAFGHWLACALVFLGTLLGAVASASAGVGFRITLATAGLPNADASFSAANTQPSAAQSAAQSGAQEAAAREAAEAKAAAQAQLRERVKALVKVYAAKSDKELTNLSAQWQELPRLDQQVLLREVKMRMARQRGRKGSVQIRTERRFGRLLRQADGSVVRVETRVVRVRPATQDEQAGQVPVRKSGYGTGFGRRSARQTERQSEPQMDAQRLPEPASKAAPPAE